MKTLDGTWNISALEVGGNKMPASGTIAVKGARFTTESMGATYEGKLKIDEKAKPHTIDMVFTAGPEKGNTNRGIFELDDDTWRLCLNMHGGERPTRFASNGNGVALETLVRGKAVKKGKETAPKMTFVPAPELEGEWQMAECVTSGEPLAAEFLSHGKRVAKGNDTTVTMMGKVMIKAKFTVDRSTKPMSIDYLLPGGKTRPGLYQLAGDKPSVNFAPPDAVRPKALKSVKGDQCTFTVWKKIK